MKSICYLVGPCAGGIKEHVSRLINYFSRSYRIILVASRGSDLLHYSFPGNITTYALDFNEFSTRIGRGYSFIRFAMILTRERPGLVHVHGYRASCWGRAVARLAGVPVIATVHGFPQYPSHSFPWSSMARRAEMIQQHWTCRYVCVSRALADFMGEKMGVSKNRLKVVYNGIDPSPFQANMEPVRRARKRLYLSGVVPGGYENVSGAKLKEKERVERGEREVKEAESFVLAGTIARLAPQKGIEVLLRAVARLAPVHPELRVVIVGEGPQRGLLERRAAKLGLSGRVNFAGYQPDLAGVLKSLDLFVLPSISEGLSITALEALSASLPVVASRTGGIPEVVREGESGILFTPGDDLDLAKKIKYLLYRPDVGRALGREGRKRVYRYFSLERMLSKTGAIYQELL